MHTQPLSRVLVEAPDVRARLIYYPAGLEQPAHRHERPKPSVLLGGALQETVAGRDVEALRPASGVKPGGVVHAVRFGPQGAVMLSLEPCGDLHSSRPPADWRPVGQGGRTLIGQLLRGEGDPAEVASLIAARIAGADRAGGAKGAPRWLTQARERLDGEAVVSVQAVADEAGVHRATLVSAFQRAYGLAPSVYRARARAQKALTLAMKGGRLADVAQDAGFADQSHMARVARRELGAPISRLTTLLKATSVQA